MTPRPTPVAGLFTVDVEPDNVWQDSHSRGMLNLAGLRSLHDLCLQHGVRPTYLATQSVIEAAEGSRLIESLLSTGTCELGAHPHLWEIPPYEPVDRTPAAPVAGAYREEIVAEKVAGFTELLRSRFGTVVSHRAGRWGLTAGYVAVLEALSYSVDSSVTPGLDWSSTGAPSYDDAPLRPYALSSVGPTVVGDSQVLEVPCTIRPGFRAGGMERSRLGRRVCTGLGIGPAWLRCSPVTSRRRLEAVCEWGRERLPCLNLMTHSSELVPGGSPYWPTLQAVDALRGDLVSVFRWWNENDVVPMTLGEYGQLWRATSRAETGTE